MNTTLRLVLLVFLSLPLRGEASSDPVKADMIVVGAGISGLCAALEGARRGASVTVIDMGSVFGGHAAMSSGMVCMVGTPEQQMN